MKNRGKGETREFEGIAVSPGMVVGKVHVYEREPFAIDTSPIAGDGLENEVVRLQNGLAEAKCQLKEIAEGARLLVGEAEANIFLAHICMLEDPCFYEDVTGKIRKAGMNAEAAVHSVLDELCRTFGQAEDEYMKERIVDIRDVGERLMRNISGMKAGDEGGVPEGAIITAMDLSPSDLALFGKKRIGGIAIQAGGRTSHTSIMAKALGIPAVIGVGKDLNQAEEGEWAVLDADRGRLILSPTSEQLALFGKENRKGVGEGVEQETVGEQQVVTTDGKRVQLMASAGTIADIRRAARVGAEGIGLLRTEFLFMDAAGLPSEEEQFSVYRAALAEMKGRPVIIRTMDIGGDKPLHCLDFPREANPALGWRGVRVSLDRPQQLKQQFRAILRVSSHGSVMVMYPMITSLSELRKMNEYLEQCKQELRDEKVLFDEAVPVGIMIETPAAAIMAEQFAEEVDFFSIGTNDLTQYTLAVDRGNPGLVHLFQPLHPAVLRLVRNVVAVSRVRGKWIGICGEATADKGTAVLFFGMGVDQISTEAGAVPVIREIISKLTYEEARRVAEEALASSSTSEVVGYIDKLLKKVESRTIV